MASGKDGLIRSSSLLGISLSIWGIEELLESQNLAHHPALKTLHDITHYLTEDSSRFRYIPYIAAGFVVYYLGKLALGK